MEEEVEGVKGQVRCVAMSFFRFFSVLTGIELTAVGSGADRVNLVPERDGVWLR